MSEPTYEIQVDGSCVPNPGIGGIAFLIRDPNGTLLHRYSGNIGQATNNIAEYTAVIAALQKALEMGLKAVRVKSDSQLVVCQVNGHYEVRSQELLPLYRQVRQLVRVFDCCELVHVPREANQEADALANRAAWA